MSCATIGRSLLGLLGDPEYQNETQLQSLSPSPVYDQLLRQVNACIRHSNPIKTAWTSRALFHAGIHRQNKVAKAKYKPVERKVRPVPTYMPQPAVKTYKPILLPQIDPLPTQPPEIEEYNLQGRITRERLDLLLSTITPEFLTNDETKLLAFVVKQREDAFAFTFAEKGLFKQEYYPDYEIPTIEYMPWQKPPIRVPKALEDDVRKEIQEQEAAGQC